MARPASTRLRRASHRWAGVLCALAADAMVLASHADGSGTYPTRVKHLWASQPPSRSDNNACPASAKPLMPWASS
jgi:hypothetical protein